MKPNHIGFPLHAHSILLTGKMDGRPSTLPYAIERNLKALQHHHPDHHHHLYGDEELRSFIERHFDAEVVRAFDNLIPLAFRADLGRYCLMFEKGGVYADLSVLFLRSMFESESDFERIVLFRDSFGAAPWITSIGIMASPPRMSVYEECIKRVCENVSKRNYGASRLCPTGPNVFGAALASTTELRRIKCGEAIRINKNKPHHNFAYISKSGELVAIAHKTGLGISSLGVPSDSAYGLIYDDRRVYRDGAREWDYKTFIDKGWTCSRFREVPDGMLVEGNENPVLFGPLVRLDPGRHRFRFDLSFDSVGEEIPVSCTFRCNKGQRELPPGQNLSIIPQVGTVAIEVEVSVSKPEEGVQARISFGRPVAFRLLKLVLEEVAPT